MTPGALAEKAFFRHNYDNEREHRPVMRSSCVFYFRRWQSVRTQIHFMNYWHEKRGISDVMLRTTLRSMDGAELTHKEVSIDRIGGHLVEVNDLLDEAKLLHTEGSIELEFTSANDLAISYPAAVVRYVGIDWHTVAHSSQRYFSESSGDEPEVIGTVREVEEGNITIHEEAAIEPFFIVHNGPATVEPSDLVVEVVASDGRTLQASMRDIGWAPYQTRLLYLKDILDYRTFLAGARGMFKLRFLIAGVFPRLIAGNEMRGDWSIDHTNFAATTGPAALDTFQTATEPSRNELVFNLPSNFADGWECFADIYPTYPPGSYDIEVNSIDSDGAKRSGRIVRAASNTVDQFPRISLDASDAHLNSEIVFRHPEKLPRRFHMGIHYRTAGGNPGFLIDGPLPYSTAAIRTRWFPVFEMQKARNFVMIANRVMGDEKPADVVFTTRLFNSFGDQSLQRELLVQKHKSECISLEELFPDASAYLGGAVGWVYMTAKSPQRCVVHYASLLGKNSIAVCHGF